MRDSQTDGAGYRNLKVWHHAVDLAVTVYTVTKSWPREEQYGLTSQARRAATSIPANIAEGRGRSSIREYLHFLSIAHGSLCELETHLEVAQRLNYMHNDDLSRVQSQTAPVGQLLNGLMRRLRSNSIQEESEPYE